jgi:hypothetical protein
MHGASTDELVIGLLGLQEIEEVDVVFKRNPGAGTSAGYLHNYIGGVASKHGLRQMVEIVTVDGISGELSHVLRTEKGMQYISSTCKGCPTGKSVSYWTMPKEEFLFEEAKEGLA